MKFMIDIEGNEYRLYRSTGDVFFILKYKYGKYYTSQLYEYEPIIEELKKWLIDIIKNNKNIDYLSFNENEVIKPMFIKHIRDEKLRQILE
jgi:hypothetical protein